VPADPVQPFVWRDRHCGRHGRRRGPALERQVKTWGQSNAGQLVDGATTSTDVPAKVPG
jgi:hypothetical protein